MFAKFLHSFPIGYGGLVLALAPLVTLLSQPAYWTGLVSSPHDRGVAGAQAVAALMGGVGAALALLGKGPLSSAESLPATTLATVAAAAEQGVLSGLVSKLP